jgi:hypothetical protein
MTFTIPTTGMLVSITNNSTTKTLNFEEVGFISPTLIPTALGSETIPATTAFVPAFKSYFKYEIAPGDTLEFTTRTNEEVAYYNQLQIDNCTIEVKDPNASNGGAEDGGAEDGTDSGEG